MTMPRACSMQVHNGQRERAERNHSNADIDKSKSGENFFVGCDDWSDAVDAMRSRVEEVDKLYPPRKKLSTNERIVCVSLVTYCPQEIYDRGLVKDFFRKADEVLRSVLGSENIHGTAVHLDEIHNYIDRDNIERSSLAHVHTLASAYAEWTDKKTGEERKGINGKNFETKAKMNELNKAMDEMCRREFGVPYMTGKGKGKGSGKSVEEVKIETQLRMAQKANDDFVRALEPEPTKTTKKFLGKEKKVDKTPEEMQRDREVLAAQAILRREDEVAEREKRVQQREAELADDEQKMTEYFTEREADFKGKEAMMKQQSAANEQRLTVKFEQEKKSLITKFEEKLTAAVQQVKALKDALFAAVVQREADELAKVPMPTAAEILVRESQQQTTEQTQAKKKGATEWQR